MATLTDYRADLDNILATAVDSSTWTDTMLDESVRQALVDYSLHGPVYEEDFTVVTAGYEQDLSGITDILKVEQVAYPWVEGSSWQLAGGRWPPATRYQPHATWRPVGLNKVYFEEVKPAASETIRVRMRKLHYVQNLDAAAATTVEDVHRRVVTLRAAAWCVEQRLRQISENPAIPQGAAPELRQAYARLMQQYMERLTGGVSDVNPSWGSIGL